MNTGGPEPNAYVDVDVRPPRRYRFRYQSSARRSGRRGGRDNDYGSWDKVIRFSGISLSYNVSYAIFGGLTPLIVTMFPGQNLFGAAHYVAALCLAGFAIGLLLWKTRIQVLSI